MNRLLRFFSSSIGQKVLMSITGLALIGFLVTHLAGNLLLFAGKEKFNAYGHALTSNPAIYLAEFGLLAIFLVHLTNAALLTLRNQPARPERYAEREGAGHTSRKSVPSSLMIGTGLVILIFIPLHIWTFKFGAYYAADQPGVRDLHQLVMEVFGSPLQASWYVIALILIGCHLWHGFGSAFESLGLPYRQGLRRLCQALTVALTLGFILIPVAIYFSGGLS